MDRLTPAGPPLGPRIRIEISDRGPCARVPDPPQPISLRAVLTLVYRLVALGIGSGFFLVGTFLDAAGAYSQGNFLAPIGVVLMHVGAVAAATAPLGKS